jgi:hypothetical protein
MSKFGTGLYKMDAGVSGWDGTWDSVTLGSTLTTTAYMSWDIFKKGGVGTLIFTTDAGTDLMQYWTGSGNAAIIAGAPKAKQIKVWQNHVWAINCEAFLLLDACDSPWTVNTLQVTSCETAWTAASSNVTCSTDVTDFKVGTASAKAVIASAFTTGLAAYSAITTVNLAAYSYLSLWVKSSVNTNSGDLEILLDDTAACASTIEQIDLPALTANVWTLVQITIATPASCTSIICIGLNVVVDNGAQTVWLDDIKAQKSGWQYLPSSCDHGDFKVGTTALGASAIIEVNSSHATGLIIAQALDSQLDLSNYTSVDFWIKSSYSSTGDADSGMKLCLDDTIDCSSSTCKEEITIPKMAANTWTYNSIALANPASDTAIRSIGIKIATDKGAQTVRIDNVRVTFSEPDRLARSAVLYYDDWNGTDSGWDDIFTSQDVGLTAIQDLKSALYICKRKSIHRVTYLGGRPLLRIDQAKSTVGTISPRTVTVIDVPGVGEKMIFLGSDRQLYTTDGYNYEPVSEAIQTDNGESSVYMNAINSTTGIDAALQMCHAINIPSLHWYVLFVPIGVSATACTHAIVYDYLGKSFWPFDTQPMTCSWLGDNGIGTDSPYVGGTNYVWNWNTSNSDDGTAIATYWESVKKALSKTGRPMLKKLRYVEGNSKINGTWPLIFSYRVDWASSYTATTAITQNVNEWTRDISQINNIVQVKISDTGAIVGSNYPDPYLLYSLDFVGEDLTVGR